MELQAFKEELKLKLSGGLLHLELDEAAISSLINASLREIQRYTDETILITIPYSKCIDLSSYNVNSVAAVYRTNCNNQNSFQFGAVTDPMFASQWQLGTGAAGMQYFDTFASNYGAWNTMLQIRNTMSTDLAYYFDKSKNLLYINVVDGVPTNISIEYVPIYRSVSDIQTDYWIDLCMRLCVALGKIALGRIRTRYTQSNALWNNDGETILAEGTAELQEIRQHLVDNSQLVYPID